MKFRCERDTLAEAIGTAQRAAAERAGLPVLSGVKVSAVGDHVELVGSDLDLTIRVQVPAQVETPGDAVVPAKLFDGLTTRLRPGAVTFEVEGDDARISAGPARASVRLLPADEFPRSPDPGGSTVTIDAGPFAQALRQVTRAASKDDARPILTGVLITATTGGLRLVATDSYRLAVRDLAGVGMLAEGQKVLVNARGLDEVARVFSSGDVQVTLGEREVRFASEARSVTTRLIEGEFPNYEQLVPAGYPNRLTIERAALEEAVRLMQIVGEGRDTTPVRLAMSANCLELSATAQERADAVEALDAKFEGTDLTVAFNPQFLLDGLLAIDGEEAVLETLDPLKPATLRGSDHPEFLYLLMPVRIS
ncbi:MAG: DNA polymerase III subunit beta [Actinobacteria bacterium]|nr:DNA polymerase III subunit beta [Actinomycetota bacterium]